MIIGKIFCKLSIFAYILVFIAGFSTPYFLWGGIVICMFSLMVCSVWLGISHKRLVVIRTLLLGVLYLLGLRLWYVTHPIEGFNADLPAEVILFALGYCFCIGSLFDLTRLLVIPKSNN